MKSSSSLIQAFYEKNGSQWTQLGERNVSTGSISIYEDDYQMLKFPMTYLQTFEDTYNKGDAGTGDGTISSLIDGYGTLITPYATYTDVLRQKIVDVTFVPSGSMILTYTTTQYYWYKAGSHHQIMAIINLVITHSSGDAMAATWSHAYSVTPALSISDDKIAHASIKIYPNPVHNNRFTVSAESGAIQKIEVTDVLGRSIFHQDYTRIQHTEVFLDQAARGTYWCTVYTDKGMSIRKISLS